MRTDVERLCAPMLADGWWGVCGEGMVRINAHPTDY